MTEPCEILVAGLQEDSRGPATNNIRESCFGHGLSAKITNLDFYQSYAEPHGEPEPQSADGAQEFFFVIDIFYVKWDVFLANGAITGVLRGLHNLSFRDAVPDRSCG